MESIYFCFWGLAASLILNQFFAMKMRKRWTREQPSGNAAEQKPLAEKKATKKTQVVPAVEKQKTQK